MAMASADGSSQSFGRLTARIGWFGLRVGGHLVLSLHSSNEPGELSQWLCHDDSTINIVVVIIIIIIIIVRSRLAIVLLINRKACKQCSETKKANNIAFQSKADQPRPGYIDMFFCTLTSASLSPVSPPDNIFALPAEVFSSCLAIVSAVMVGGLFLSPALRYGTGYQTVWEILPSAETPSSVQWRRFFIFSLLVYIAH